MTVWLKMPRAIKIHGTIVFRLSLKDFVYFQNKNRVLLTFGLCGKWKWRILRGRRSWGSLPKFGLPWQRIFWDLRRTRRLRRWMPWWQRWRHNGTCRQSKVDSSVDFFVKVTHKLGFFFWENIEEDGFTKDETEKRSGEGDNEDHHKLKENC